MRLCRRAPGSHPAPVPRCRGGAARWKGVRPCRVPYPCRRVHRVPVRQRKALSGRLRATDSERARGGGSGTRARASLSGFRGMTGSRPAQRTVWTNPALWSATNQENFCCCGQGPVDGAGVLGAGRPVRENSRKAAARGRWTGSEVGEGRGSGEGRGIGEGRCRAVKAGKDGIAICGQAGAPHRTAPQKVPVSSDPGRGAPCRKRGRLAVCAAPKLHRVSACPGPTGHFMLFLRYGAEPCRRLQKIFPH